MNHKPQRQTRSNTREVHIRVTGSVLDAFDRYGKEIASERNRPAVSRSIVFERLVTDAQHAGIIR